MLETIIVILVILWLVGFFGGGRWGRGRATGWAASNLIHILLVVAIILLVFRLLR